MNCRRERKRMDNPRPTIVRMQHHTMDTRQFRQQRIDTLNLDTHALRKLCVIRTHPILDESVNELVMQTRN